MVTLSLIKKISEPSDIFLMERMEWGSFIGTVKGLNLGGTWIEGDALTLEKINEAHREAIVRRKHIHKIEDLFDSLRGRYTIIIVTHNMQQAARVSDNTAFMYLGKLIEFGETKVIFTNPKVDRTEDYVTGRFG